MENTMIILSIFLIPFLVGKIAFAIGTEIAETIEHKKAIKAIRDLYHTHPGESQLVDAIRKDANNGVNYSLKVC